MKLPSLRIVSQVSVLVLVLALALAHQWWGVEKAAPLDAYCPFGALESLPTLLTDGNFLQKIFISNYLLLGVFTVMTLLFGRVFCGYFCPLGAVQEWLTRLGRALGIRKAYELPPSVDRVLRYAKYLVLAGVIFLSWAYASLVFRDYDPFIAFGHLGQELDELMFAYVALAAVVVLSLFTKSWWCRYLCPLGAFFGIVRKIGLFRLVKAPSCAGCGACAMKCPAGLDPKAPSSANDADCVSCMGCVGKCPSSSLAPVVAGKKLSRRAFDAVVVRRADGAGPVAVLGRRPRFQPAPAGRDVGPFRRARQQYARVPRQGIGRPAGTLPKGAGTARGRRPQFQAEAYRGGLRPRRRFRRRPGDGGVPRRRGSISFFPRPGARTSPFGSVAVGPRRI